MELLNVFLSSIGSLIALFFLAKLMGNKQMSELNMFDYITGITIGSIAAEMATSLENDFLKPLLAMVIYALISILLSYISTHTIKLRRLINGRAIFLYDKGKIYKKNLHVAKLDVNEMLAQCRIMGYFSLEDIETIILESNGKLSVLPKAQKRPCTPADLAISVSKDRPETVVVLEGEILVNNLRYTGNDKNWLSKQLQNQNVSLKDVFIASCNSDNMLNVYVSLNEKHVNDIFQ